ncbi:DUF4272 domain-containing protein [Flavilitoribacter nigricans]|uniref:DUF4272 domain-containing protein n=1 Tax=Flavilitoribacter nigricans (strain ATCC 23147 / DSM 23189 / NBRC 102662 / NCIMB 1420 / SS-2) TaxID=1122177 RepID=A0A2D0MZ38_FLAN2|nr:DUF4272 domain-containing protein [Flavilitoribacter nigricans]PHN01386.1 hypothetical protein CRP01_37615 [Flavilitoribacter nigricans DSM 23189 = NBRC 102662]
MENCTIYSHQLDFEKVVQIVKAGLPKARIEYNDGGLHKSLIATIKGGLFGKTKTLKINYRQRENPSYKLEQADCALSQNLVGMVNFIQSLPADNEAVRDKFLYKVMSVNCEIPFMAEPAMTPEFESVLRKIVHKLDGFVFAQPNRVFNRSNGQHFVDKNLELILDTQGHCDIQDIEVNVNAKYHDPPRAEYTAEQLERKAKSEAFLETNGIKVNKNLPCSPAAATIDLRALEAVIDRAYALLITAVKGEGIEQEHLNRAVADKKIDSFSPKENYIYRATSLDERERAYATWRYESLYTMLWALGKMDELKYPNEICEVQTVVGKIFHPSRAEFESSVALRSKSEILDELDRTFRMNWACVDARIKGQAVSGNINPAIIYERHYSLNWLTNYQDQDWDDVQTNT